jgi:hypothetical protein
VCVWFGFGEAFGAAIIEAAWDPLLLLQGTRTHAVQGWIVAAWKARQHFGLPASSGKISRNIKPRSIHRRIRSH